MALRIQLLNGQVKDYKTWYESSDDGMPIYRTECKMKFRGKPDEMDGCDHIECAMKSANWGKEENREISRVLAFVAVFWILVALITVIFEFESDFRSAALWLAAMYMAFGSICYYQYITKENSNEYIELIEFKENGTINSVEAKQI